MDDAITSAKMLLVGAVPWSGHDRIDVRDGDGCDAVDDRGDVLRRAHLNRSGPQRRPNRRVDVPAANRRALQ
eukprot:3214851-Prymnesium_polylepis.1